MRREISCVRPPMRPFTDSRSERVFVAEGSIAYSAVTHPSPESLRHRGTPTDAEAAHSTLVRPNSTSTDPAGWSCQCRVNVMGRSSSSARPSARVMRLSLDTAGPDQTSWDPEVDHWRHRPPPWDKNVGRRTLPGEGARCSHSLWH